MTTFPVTQARGDVTRPADACQAHAANYPAGFYVYRLCDPRNGQPFYVGKGQRRRAWAHQRDIERGRSSCNARKDAVIRAILSAGAHVRVEIVATYLRESDALNHEFSLVDATLGLTNVMPGGGGGSLSERESARRAVARLVRLRRLRVKERAEAEREERETSLDAFLARAKSPAERAQVAEWLASLDPASAAKILTPQAAAVATRAKAFEPKPEKAKRRLGGQRGRLFGRGRIDLSDYD